jgi:hypothetical protein
MNRGQKMLVTLIALTAAPFVLAQLAYHYYQGSQPTSTTNKGTLLKPIENVTKLALVPLPGPAMPARKWTLLLYRPATCDAACASDVQRLRAMPILLGREGGRVAPVLIVDDPSVATPDTPDNVPALPRVRAGGRIGGHADGLFVVDPMGNVVLWYDHARIGKPVLDDLRFLLKNSSIG